MIIPRILFPWERARDVFLIRSKTKWDGNEKLEEVKEMELNKVKKKKSEFLRASQRQDKKSKKTFRREYIRWVSNF